MRKIELRQVFYLQYQDILIYKRIDHLQPLKIVT